MVTQVALIPTGYYKTMRQLGYKYRKDHNFLHNMDMNNTDHTGTRNHIRNHIRIRDRAHNTFLPKNDGRGDKILVAYFVYILHY